MSGNMNKVTPVTALDDTQYQVGPIARRARESVLGLGGKRRAREYLGIARVASTQSVGHDP